jgi:transcriptional regulator with XRE-family HTH domain
MELEHPLRAYRNALGISFADAAVAIGISQAQLSRIETRKQLPQPDVILRIAEWTKNRVTADALLGIKKGKRAA